MWRDFYIALYGRKIIQILDLDRIAVPFHVLNPTATAASGGGTINGNYRTITFYHSLLFR